MNPPFFHHLPAPLGSDTYSLLRRGIADDSEVSVYISAERDFAFLDPRPTFDYTRYRPRVQSLGLSEYKVASNVSAARLVKIAPLLDGATSFLEVGAADAAFLQVLHRAFPDLACATIEPDQNTRAARDVLPWLTQFSTPAEAKDYLADWVALFHVFEHLEVPSEMLNALKSILGRDGRLLIEVPTLRDPLLSLYRAEAYEAFYFQRQHPYVYTAASLARVLDHNGYSVDQIIPYQRYGLENHLQWLTAGRPGGDPRFRNLFANLAEDYKRALEADGTTDTVFVIARVM